MDTLSCGGGFVNADDSSALVRTEDTAQIRAKAPLETTAKINASVKASTTKRVSEVENNGQERGSRRSAVGNLGRDFLKRSLHMNPRTPPTVSSPKMEGAGLDVASSRMLQKKAAKKMGEGGGAKNVVKQKTVSAEAKGQKIVEDVAMVQGSGSVTWKSGVSGGKEGAEKGKKKRVGDRVAMRGERDSSDSEGRPDKKTWQRRRRSVCKEALGGGVNLGEARKYGLRGLRKEEKVLEEFEGEAETDEVMIPKMMAMREDMEKFLAGEEIAEALISLYLLIKTPMTRKQIKDTGLYRPVMDCAIQIVNVNIRWHAKAVLKVWEDNHLLKYVEENLK